MNHKAHKYKRVTLGKEYTVYKCILPGCKHFIRRELVIGRIALCWVCGSEFVMNEKSAELLKPHCKFCKRSNRTFQEVA